MKIHKTTTLHYKAGTSNKVYIAITVENENWPGANQFSTFFLYGKIWKKDLTYVAGCENVSLSTAESDANKQILAKLKKGYLDITDHAYHDILKTTDGWLGREISNAVNKLGDGQPTGRPAEAESPKGKTLMEIFAEADARGECVCVDSFGIEEFFTEGDTYECRKHEEVPTMLWVKDRHGKEKELMLRRFEVKKRAKQRASKL